MTVMNRCIVLVYVLYMLRSCESFSCLEGRCSCIGDGLVLCPDVINQEILDLTDQARKEFTQIVVSPDMDCQDVKRLEHRSQMTVINRDCTGKRAIAQLGMTTKGTGSSVPHYIYETLTCVLVLISLIISAKIKHNVQPLVSRLPRQYTSNTTFIRNFFKVC
jgi:adenylosuccinate synthase